jgi:molecular chaperone GrpE (heat shock protein)
MRKFLKIVIPVDDGLKIPKSSGHESTSTKEQAIGEVKSLAAIATNAWKAKAKMLDGTSGEVREEMKRVYRHVEGILESLQEIGIEIRDHTGDAFDYGLPLKVVTTQPTPGITKEKVIETIKPTVYWQKQIIQMGEVVVATPVPSQEKP